MLGQRLKIARTGAGLSLRDLADRIGNQVSAQMIGRYERNEALPGSTVLIAIADALAVSENYLLDPTDLRLEGVEFRKNRLTSRKDEAAVEAAVLDAVERYLAIEDVVGAASAAWTAPPGAPFPVQNNDGAELAAATLRSLWNLGLDATPNLAEFLEEQGIKVVALPLPNSVSGLMSRVRRRDGRLVPVIVVNEVHTGERQRLTIAHELGHLMLEIAPDLDEEKASFRFGSAFLMPAELLWAEVGRYRRALSIGELLELKKLFGVSAQAIAYRCKDLGIIGPGAYRALFQAFARLGWRSPPYPEPNALPPERPRRFRRLCFRALAEGLVSEFKAAELLRISVRQLDREMAATPSPQP
jgi:Zn-dependent peptidase ImmA (M78 family)/DNA-binding XRE family transcriptional regulator